MKTVKTILVCSTLLAIFFFSSLSSCKKEDVIQNVTNVTDTIYAEHPITAQLICTNNLQIQEVRGVRGGSILYYLRGGSGNTQSFDNEYIKLNTDNSGLYHENSGIERAITWNFTNSTNTKLVVNFTNTPASFSVTWDNIRYKDGKWYYDEYYTDGNTGQNSHAQFVKVPKP